MTDPPSPTEPPRLGERAEAQEEGARPTLKGRASPISAKEIGKVATAPERPQRPPRHGGGEGREPGHCAEGGGGFSEHMASLHMTHWRREESNNACQTQLGLNTLFWTQVTTTPV